MSANDQYSLNWSNHTTHIKKAFDSLWSGNQFVDVTLSCEGKKINAHKMLLSACSVYFHDLFQDNPCQHPIVILRDVKFDNLLNILKFIYSGEVSVASECFDEFLKTAELLQISGLVDEEARNSMSERDSQPSQSQKQTHVNDSNLELAKQKESIRKRPSEINSVNEVVEKKKKDNEVCLDVQIKQENIVEEDLFVEVKDPLDLEEQHNESTEGDLLQPAPSQKFVDVQDLLNGQTMDNISESDDEFKPDTTDADNSGTSVLLPDKSKQKYKNSYEQFKEWCIKNNISDISENVVLAYFEEKATKVKSPTLWSLYSMLKSMLNIKDNIDITKFTKLVPYLKEKSVGHHVKKCPVFTRDQVNKFLTEANNETYLMMKIILIMGISGACRRDELTQLTIDDVEDKGSILVVKHSFTISNPNYIELYRKYVSLRPNNATSRRLFLKYYNKKCLNQVVGIHTIGSVPSLIAKYLSLPNPETYTAHCFRRTSPLLFSNS